MNYLLQATINQSIMNEVFYWCVDILKLYSKRWGMTYEELNVWIFCIIEPIVFIIMLYLIIAKTRKLKKMKKATPQIPRIK